MRTPRPAPRSSTFGRFTMNRSGSRPALLHQRREKQAQRALAAHALARRSTTSRVSRPATAVFRRPSPSRPRAPRPPHDRPPRRRRAFRSRPRSRCDSPRSARAAASRAPSRAPAPRDRPTRSRRPPETPPRRRRRNRESASASSRNRDTTPARKRCAPPKTVWTGWRDSGIRPARSRVPRDRGAGK